MNSQASATRTDRSVSDLEPPGEAEHSGRLPDQPHHADDPNAAPSSAHSAPSAHADAVPATEHDDAADSQPETQAQPGQSKTKPKRGLIERAEAYLARLSTRNNFWHRVCSWIWLPFAYRSGIRMRRDGQTISAVLPFRRFNRNWYDAMAGAALLGNSEIAGGMHVFKACGGNHRVVCKHLEYRFLRPCVGPAMYRVTPREDIEALVRSGKEFNITVDMEIVQVMRSPNEQERRVGRCTATFHATPTVIHKEKLRRKREQRKKLAGQG